MRTAPLVAALALTILGAPARAFDDPVALKVLYAGDPKSERTADFRSFLEKHFAKVGLGDYLGLTQADTRGYDVVILDWPGLPPRDDHGFKRPSLDRDYDRPTILIGGGTLAIGRHFELKLRDLCVCLGDAAHGIRTEHEIFQKPFKIEIAWEDRRTPSYYRDWPEGAKLGSTIKVWKVEERGWSVDRPNDLSTIPGMVSDPYGFEDSPDAEVFSGGLNMKSPASVALGRHGNFLLWGFYSPPSGLTPEARKCLVNTICYIRKFDGRKPIVRRKSQSRDWALVYASYMKQFADQDWVKTLFPEDVRRQFGNDPEKYRAYCRENLEYLIGSEGGNRFAVDQDVRGLGASNRKVELLDRCVSMLERNDQPELARRILGRYTTENFPQAQAWRAWLEANRRRLFFTDVGGFKFLAAAEPIPKSAPEGSDEEKPDASNPVAAKAELSPAKVRPGDTLDLVVRVKLAPSWHIYAVGGSQGPGIATTLKLILPKGVEPEGQWSSPDPVPGSDGQMIYEGTPAFRQRLRVAKSLAQGPIDVSCELGYQACDPFSCRAPTKLRLTARGNVD